MISVCISNKDRSLVTTKGGIDLYLFPNSVKSIVEASKKLDFPIELVVVDYESIDFPVEEWIYKMVGDAFPIKLLKLPHDETFSRGKALNIAAENASYDYLFFSDTDMVMDENVFNYGLKFLNEGKSYYPMFFSYSNYKNERGWWRNASYGMVFVKKEIWSKVRIPEYYVWGEEDNHFRDGILKYAPIVREKCEGLFHQWHPLVAESTTRGVQDDE